MSDEFEILKDREQMWADRAREAEARLAETEAALREARQRINARLHSMVGRPPGHVPCETACTHTLENIPSGPRTLLAIANVAGRAVSAQPGGNGMSEQKHPFDQRTDYEYVVALEARLVETEGALREAARLYEKDIQYADPAEVAMWMYAEVCAALAQKEQTK